MALLLPDNELEPGMRFRVDLIDTWNMTVTPVEQTFTVEPLNRYKFVDTKRQTIWIPARPYMALRIARVK